MPIAMQTSGVHHNALRVSDLARARRFHVDTLGRRYVAFEDLDRIAWELYVA